MIDINEHDFHKLDLNLLLVFTALLRERSVTLAARRLYLGQPAMSAALARLRTFAGDDLFVRTARGMEPTTHALALAARLKPVLEGLGAALFTTSAFDPSSSDRTFSVGMFDIGEVTLGPELLGDMEAEAPRVRLALRPVDRASAAAQLEAGTLDLAITDIGATTGGIRTKLLYQEFFACIFDPKVVRARTPISLKDYLAYPHLLTSFGGEFIGYVDEVLAQRGLARHVTMTTTRFSTLPFVLRRFRGIASLPATAARELGGALGLVVSPLPVEVPPVDLSLVWHGRHDSDTGHQWLRDLVYRVCMRLAPPRPRPRSSDQATGRERKARRASILRS